MSIPGIGSAANALQSALTGINTSLENLNQDAQTVAQSVTPSGNMSSTTAALVDSLQQKLVVEASANLLSTENQTLGTIIDVTA